MHSFVFVVVHWHNVTDYVFVFLAEKKMTGIVMKDITEEMNKLPEPQKTYFIDAKELKTPLDWYNFLRLEDRYRVSWGYVSVGHTQTAVTVNEALETIDNYTPNRRPKGARRLEPIQCVLDDAKGIYTVTVDRD